MTTPTRPILVAEDDESDATLLRLAFKRAGLPYQLVVVSDGQAVIDYLSGHPPYEDRSAHPLPGMLLLDLKMPRLNGFDVLAWWSAQAEFRGLPVVVLSSSSHPTDIARSLEMGAREYIVKPHGFMQLAQLMSDLCTRWLSMTMACS